MGKTRQAGGDDDAKQSHKLVVALEDFAWEALVEEAQRLGASTEELARYALLYYLADLDSGRIARRLPMQPFSNAKRGGGQPASDGFSGVQ